MKTTIVKSHKRKRKNGVSTVRRHLRLGGLLKRLKVKDKVKGKGLGKGLTKLKEGVSEAAATVADAAERAAYATNATAQRVNNDPQQQQGYYNQPATPERVKVKMSKSGRKMSIRSW